LSFDKKVPLKSGILLVLLVIALAGTLATAMTAFVFIAFGRGNPSMVGYGIVSTSLFAFLLTIQFSHGKAESKDDFLKKGPVRTAIATSLTVAYLMLLAFGLDSGLGLNFNNGILANFHLVYIFVIGSYFVTASLERIVDLVKGKSSLFGN
jgi:succinate dehydrogenase hydrophobic anchor subunit